MWLKLNTPAGRMADLSVLELEDGTVGAGSIGAAVSIVNPAL